MSVTLRRRGILLCLIGPAGGGKTSHAESLVRRYGPSIQISVSATTRAPREGERDGVHYHFLSPDEFQRRIDRGDFFEYERVHDQLYGTLQSTLTSAIESGIDLILDIDINGALNLRRAYPTETVLVFIVPPSAAALRERVRNRSSIGEAELARRLTTARTEYERLIASRATTNEIDYFVVNNDRDTAFEELRSILIAERAKLARIDQHDLGVICTVD